MIKISSIIWTIVLLSGCSPSPSEKLLRDEMTEKYGGYNIYVCENNFLVFKSTDGHGSMRTSLVRNDNSDPTHCHQNSLQPHAVINITR